ncbi:MAG: hypothetical protein K0R21_1876 [Anaerocolumna sp.]|jgi:hypothetical protein|nr:hypothetical protein [Anaerocolumna sp.]
MLKWKKKNYKFTDIEHSVKGLISFILGIVSMIAFLVVSYLSSLSGGNGGFGYGVTGIILFIVAIGGLILGVQSFKEKDIYYNAPIAGVVMNGFFVCVYFILYIMGFSL